MAWKSVLKAIPIVAVLTVPAGMVLAQDADDSRGGWWQGWGMGQMMNGPFGGGPMMGQGPMMGFGWDGMADRVDGRLAFIKTELAIRDDQTAEWDAFAAMVRENAENHNGLMQSMMERMWGDGYADTPLPERLKEHEGFMTARLAQIQDMRAAVEALYAVLDEDQKKSADEIMMPAMGMGMGMGMGRGGSGMGPGMMR